ncbi:hypothetical protein BD408DRAFT_411670 [Parasitella parasitica]|nr:hypothetical protein BD408DRAFT_411670 [Parasitella parasitica]
MCFLLITILYLGLALSVFAFRYFKSFIFPIQEPIRELKELELYCQKILILIKLIENLCANVRGEIQDMHTMKIMHHNTLLSQLNVLETQYVESTFQLNELGGKINAMENHFTKSIESIENQRNHQQQIIGSNFMALTKYTDGIREYLEEQERVLENFMFPDEMILLLRAIRDTFNERETRFNDLEPSCKKQAQRP